MVAGGGRHLHALAHNRDPRPVDIGWRRRSIGSQRALGRSPKSPEDLDAALMALVERVTWRMRDAGRTGRTVVLRLRFDDLLTGDPLPHPALADQPPTPSWLRPATCWPRPCR